jgi:hypothetical protein
MVRLTAAGEGLLQRASDRERTDFLNQIDAMNANPRDYEEGAARARLSTLIFSDGQLRLNDALPRRGTVTQPSKGAVFVLGIMLLDGNQPAAPIQGGVPAGLSPRIREQMATVPRVSDLGRSGIGIVVTTYLEDVERTSIEAVDFTGTIASEIIDALRNRIAARARRTADVRAAR